MEFAYAILHWSPKQFWEATMFDILAANEGVIKANKDPNEAEPMTTAEFEELRRKLGDVD